jgi:NAD(P)H-hydrate epimerase
MRTVTVQQIQQLDKTAIEEIGIPSLALMENAGRSVAQEIVHRARRIKRPRVCIICGVGNNAGDGFVAARHLINAGIDVKIFLVGQGGPLKRDAAVNLRILRNLNCPIQNVGPQDLLSLREIAKAHVVVDAMFGVGLNREVTDPFWTVIEAVNKMGKRVVAVDIPSGLDGTTGKVYGVCVKADITVTFSFIKRGFLKGQGPKYVGKVVVADIGIPRKLSRKLT